MKWLQEKVEIKIIIFWFQNYYISKKKFIRLNLLFSLVTGSNGQSILQNAIIGMLTRHNKLI